MRKHAAPVPGKIAARHDKVFLVVDDEEPNRRFISRALSEFYPDARIEQAADGLEAGNKIRALIPALVILDILMPKANGFEVCEMVRNTRELMGIKILIITGCDVEELKPRILAAGADDMLHKPFELEELENKVRRLMARPRGPGAPREGGTA